MKPGRTAIILTLALLLTACGAPQAADATPTPERSGVAVHWDALEPEPEAAANRYHDNYAAGLRPADDYGELVPYIGGEASDEYWNQSWFFGLATRGGEIVTDPVYLGVEALTEMGADTLKDRYGKALILSTAVPSETEPKDEWTPKYEERYGLAAIDGSWYTGQVYTDVICSCALGAFFFDAEGNAVMLSGDDGSEIFRWEAGAILLEGLTPGSSYWEIASARDGYMQYIDWDGSGEADYTYVDLRTGSIVDGQPEAFAWRPAADAADTDESRYYGGVYRIEDGRIYIEADSGETYSLALPEGCSQSAYPAIDGERMIFSLEGGGSVLVDFSGRELLRTDKFLNWLYYAYGEEPRLCATTDYLANDDGTDMHTIWNVYSRDGELLLTADGTVTQWGDRLLIADETAFRLTDLDGGELIRLSRWDSLDIPAEE